MKQITRRLLALSLVKFLFVAVAFPAGADIQITDIGATWAKNHIESLVVQGIVQPAPDGTFRPNNEISRAEFARMANTAFSPAPKKEIVLTDIQNHPARRSILALARAGILLHEDSGRFLPDQSLTRAELFTALVQLLDLDELTWAASDQSLADVDPDHSAFDAMQTAHRLKLLPPYVLDVLQPTLPATRAEAAAAINEALMLDIKNGLVETVDASSRTITLLIGQDRREIRADQDIAIFRNGQPSFVRNIQVGDTMRVIYDRLGREKLIVVSGIEEQDTPATVVESEARGYITPSDLRAIFTGDWSQLRQSVKGKLTDELVNQGMGPEEATAVIERDWDLLRQFGQSIVTSMIQSRLGVSESLAQGILNGDWTSVKQKLAEEEMIDQLINQWLLTMNG